MAENHTPALDILGGGGQTVDGSADDVRGWQVKDENGDGSGEVADLLVDGRENKVRFLLVDHGGFLGLGETKSVIPVDAVTKFTQGDVFVDQSRERVAAAPGCTPDLVDDRPCHSSIYTQYGYAPCWGGGSMYAAGLAILPMSPPLIRG